VHSIDTGKKIQLHRPIASFVSYKRVVYYASIMIFNTLTASTAVIVKDKKHYLNYQHEINIDDCCIRKEL
jgi:hypothetical protein